MPGLGGSEQVPPAYVSTPCQPALTFLTIDAELRLNEAPLNSQVEADCRAVLLAMLWWWTNMPSPKPSKVFSRIAAVNAPNRFWLTVIRGVSVHDSLAVLAVKLQTVVNVPIKVFPMPAAW